MGEVLHRAGVPREDRDRQHALVRPVPQQPDQPHLRKRARGIRPWHSPVAFARGIRPARARRPAKRGRIRRPVDRVQSVVPSRLITRQPRCHALGVPFILLRHM